jgi:2,3-diketo-5-methylthio-1-phosphopentane phosphatase
MAGCWDAIRQLANETKEKEMKKLPVPPLLVFEFHSLVKKSGIVEDLPVRLFTNPDAKFSSEYLFTCGPNERAMKQVTSTLKMKEGIMDLIQSAHAAGIEMIIVSDTVDIVIDWFLQLEGIRHYFTEVFCNHAKFDEHDILMVKPYKCPCARSQWKMCKAKLLNEYTRDQKRVVALVGRHKIYLTTTSSQESSSCTFFSNKMAVHWTTAAEVIQILKTLETITK